MRIIYSFLSILLLFVLGSCQHQSTNSSKPIDVSFIELSYMDTSIRPGDNFYDYAGGTWRKNNPVPASETRWGAFDMLSEFNKKVLKELTIEASENPGAENSPSQMVGDLFSSGMDTNRIEELGVKPILSELDKIVAIKTKEKITTYLAELTQSGSNPLFRFSVSTDDKNVSQYLVSLRQGGLGLPDRDYYLKSENRENNIREKYRIHIANMFKLKGDSEADAANSASVIMDIETKLAKASMDRTEMRDPYKTYNKSAFAGFGKNAKVFNWPVYFGAVGVEKQDSLLVGQPVFFSELDNLLEAVSLDNWKTYFTWHTLRRTSGFLSSDFVNENFEFFGKALSGQKEQKPRWKKVLGVINGTVGHQLGKLYVKKYFTPDAKKRMGELVDNLQETFGERIEKLEWMSAETKVKAQDKLSTFVKKIGYPNEWRSYDGLEISADNYLDNIKASRIFNFQYQLNKLGKPVDKMEWYMTPQTVNAYYNPSFNEIVFPAGILQYPFFTLDADDAVIYGAIGAVIGHEITHGFDDKGSQYAADGNLKNWWTEEDRKKFDARTKVLENQFNNYTLLDNKTVNGALTLGENIADLGGVTIGYEAFKKTKQAQKGELIDGFTPEQRFFLSWAQVWRLNIVDEEAAKRLVTDPHSPGIFRCNGPLSNFEPFYVAFDVNDAHKMYRTKNERVVIW